MTAMQQQNVVHLLLLYGVLNGIIHCTMWVFAAPPEGRGQAAIAEAKKQPAHEGLMYGELTTHHATLRSALNHCQK
jgi:hypothetical protein